MLRPSSISACPTGYSAIHWSNLKTGYNIVGGRQEQKKVPLSVDLRSLKQSFMSAFCPFSSSCLEHTYFNLSCHGVCNVHNGLRWKRRPLTSTVLTLAQRLRVTEHVIEAAAIFQQRRPSLRHNRPALLYDHRAQQDHCQLNEEDQGQRDRETTLLQGSNQRQEQARHARPCDRTYGKEKTAEDIVLIGTGGLKEMTSRTKKIEVNEIQTQHGRTSSIRAAVWLHPHWIASS